MPHGEKKRWESGEYVLRAPQPLPVGVCILQASEGKVRLSQRLLVTE